MAKLAMKLRDLLRLQTIRQVILKEQHILIFSSSKTEAKRVVKLVEEGVSVGHVGSLAGRNILHQKMLLADGAYAVYGSANGTQHSRDKCFELVTLTSFPGIVANLEDRPSHREQKFEDRPPGAEALKPY